MDIEEGGTGGVGGGPGVRPQPGMLARGPGSSDGSQPVPPAPPHC